MSAWTDMGVQIDDPTFLAFDLLRQNITAENTSEVIYAKLFNPIF